ncbi:MAG: cadmium-translocating P-type ATPase [Gemmataceae bacterium]|nr:cadmium-translocating P-type ATPase [Gemmataceae bacterium]
MNSAQLNLQFKIHGMDCAEEVTVLKRELGPVVGGEGRLRFDILSGKMTVAASGELSPETVLRAVARTGMRAEVWQAEATATADQPNWRRRERTLLTTASGSFAVAGFLTHVVLAGGVSAAIGSEGMGAAQHVPWISRGLYAAGILAGLWVVLPKAWLALRQLRPDMNLLMTIAAVGAVAIGEWFEGATVAFLFALSLALESWSVGRARRAVEALLDLTPPTARVLTDANVEREQPAGQVPVGALILIKAGERFPLDGTIVRGSSDVNQAPITGESVPVPKKPGDEVFAGTINGDAALEVRTTKPAGDTTLAHIIRMVGDAQSRRAPAEQWVEKFARVYTPVVLALALAVFLVPPVFFGGAWQDWFYRALVLLVIACPCALVISTPVTIVAALAAAARNGVLIKGGAYVEAPAHVRAIAFDKTGTLTEGRPAVVEVVPLGGHDEAALLERVAALEARSEHPVGKAIVAYAQERGIPIRPAADFEIVPGRGATAQLDGKEFWLGSHRYLEERGQETADVHEKLVAMSGPGRTVVAVGNESHVCGLIGLADAVRPEARQTLQALRDAGVGRLVLLTGDNAATADAIGRQTGVDEVRAELLPADKVQAVEELVARHGSVAMIGDGVNDAPALARAGLGIAMGAIGSDAAIEAADIALMADDLAKLPWLIHHSRRTLRVVRQNIGFALSVKAAFVLLTFAGYASLWAAIAADMGASLVVIFNGLRLLRPRRLAGPAATPPRATEALQRGSG